MDQTNTTPEATQAAVIHKRAASKGRKAVEKKAQQLERLAVEYVPITSIHANDYNPNRQSEHDFELLLRSMEEDGFTQPIIINHEGIIVDGEHRWRAALTLGYQELPVVRVNMSVEQARISTIRHNRARGSHDLDLEAAVLRDLQALGALDWAQDSLMLDDIEINRLLNDIAAPEELMAEEYSEAWIPDSIAGDDAELIKQGTSAATRLHEGGEAVTALSASAVETQRKREALIKQARTEQERQMIRADTRLYRVSLMFAGEEAEIVKQALGDKPAEALLELCRGIV